MIRKLGLCICLSASLAGCGSVSSSTVDHVAISEQSTGPVFITQSDLPEGLEYEVIGVVKANARQGYSSAESLYPLLGDEARKVGANAVIKAYGGRSVAAFSWAAPFAGGTAVKVKNTKLMKSLDGNFF